MTTNKTIFTYFEENNSPPYLNLCIDTWKKNLPDGFKIVKLNKKNFREYLSANTLPDSLNINNSSEKMCSSPYFYEFLASAVLYSRGGIFLQPDTILTEKFEPPFVLLKNTDLLMFSNGQCSVHKGFMMANKHSALLEELLRRYFFASFLPKTKKTSNIFILNDVIKEFSQKDVMLLDSEDFGYLMEKAMFGVYSDYLYKKYYFTNICSHHDFFNHSKGITALNNAQTPCKYKKMSAEDFLNQDILLSKIFKGILTAQSS